MFTANIKNTKNKLGLNRNSFVSLQLATITLLNPFSLSRASGVILFIMETTRRDYLNRLPEDIRSEAIKNVGNDGINKELGYTTDEVLDERVDAKNALIGAFAWNVNDKMSQVEYWSDINDKYFSHE